MGNKCGSGQTQDTDLPQEPRVTVFVKGAYGLPVGEWQPGNDRFLYFAVGAEPGGEDFFKSSQKQNVVDPVWNEECEVPANVALKISVFQADADGNPTMLAVATLDLPNASADSFTGELPLEAEGVEGAVLVLKAKGGDEYAAETPGEFNIKIDNQKKKALGIELDSMDPEKLYVTGVKKNSVVDIYNESQLDNKLEPGLFITGVEGPEVGSGGCLGIGSSKSSSPATPSGAMEKILTKNPNQVDMVCRRAIQFRIAVTLTQDQRLGINVPQKPMGNSLIITSVQANCPVSDWNANNPDQTVEPWDRIIAVNGQSGKVADLQKHIKTAQQSGRIIITLVRMSPTVNRASPEAGEAA